MRAISTPGRILHHRPRIRRTMCPRPRHRRRRSPSNRSTSPPNRTKRCTRVIRIASVQRIISVHSGRCLGIEAWYPGRGIHVCLVKTTAVSCDSAMQLRVRHGGGRGIEDGDGDGGAMSGEILIFTALTYNVREKTPLTREFFNDLCMDLLLGF